VQLSKGCSEPSTGLDRGNGKLPGVSWLSHARRNAGDSQHMEMAAARTALSEGKLRVGRCPPRMRRPSGDEGSFEWGDPSHQHATRAPHRHHEGKRPRRTSNAERQGQPQKTSISTHTQVVWELWNPSWVAAVLRPGRKRMRCESSTHRGRPGPRVRQGDAVVCRAPDRGGDHTRRAELLSMD
jgi:hypothetical protein